MELLADTGGEQTLEQQKTSNGIRFIRLQKRQSLYWLKLI